MILDDEQLLKMATNTEGRAALVMVGRRTVDRFGTAINAAEALRHDCEERLREYTGNPDGGNWNERQIHRWTACLEQIDFALAVYKKHDPRKEQQ